MLKTISHTGSLIELTVEMTKLYLFLPYWLSDFGNTAMNAQSLISNFGSTTMKLQSPISNFGSAIMKLQSSISDFGNTIMKNQI